MVLIREASDLVDWEGAVALEFDEADLLPLTA
jgi:hypothetical protein